MTGIMILDHISIVVAALLCAIVVGVPLGILSYFYPSARKIILRVVDLLQTTPALALRGIIMVFLGAGKPTVIIGLALYSLLPIVRNTCLGLNQVPDYLVEAGKGMGMSRMQRLLRVEMPLATPILFTGIRIAAVNAVGTAVFAAFVGGGGLGNIAINYGYYRYETDMMFVTVVILVVIVQIIQETWMKLSKVSDKRIR